MNKIYAILLVFLFSSCATLQVTTATKAGDIIEAKGTKDELYIKANQWMVKSFNNAKIVIQFQDKESGKIMGKYLLHGEFGMNSQFGYIQQSPDVFALITIMVKDNAAKIDIEPQGSWKSVGSGKEGFSESQSFTTEKAQSNIKALIEDFKIFMTTSTKSW